MAEVLIEGIRLDTKEGLDFSFNYSIADVRDPNKRSTEYSKTIKCPGTKNNDLLFGNIWSVNIANPYDSTLANVEVNFNPNKKAEAVVIADGVTVIECVVQLRQINIQKEAYEYEVVFIGKLFNFFSEIGKKKLNEIDFSDLNHIYDRNTIVSSWFNTDYTYPMIDYGDDFDSLNGLKVWRVRQFRPAIFAKEIMDRIFAFAGFTYTSAFITSSPFTNLIVPFSGEQIFADDSQTNDRKFKASLSSPEGAYSSGDFTNITTDVDFRTLRLDDDSTGDNFDTGNNWSNVTWVYDVPNDGYYGFEAKQSIRLNRTTVNASRIYGGQVNISLQIIRTDTSLNTSIIGESTQAFTLTGNPSSFDTTLDIAVSCEEQLLFDGDKVQFRTILGRGEFTATNLSGQSISKDNLFTDFELTTPSAFGLSNPSNVIFEGDTMPMNSVVPDMTMEEFITSVLKMFNLYVTVDPENETNLIIETRDEYYGGGTIRDWSKKLARDRKRTVKPLGLLAARVYDYKYKEDSDYYNERFQTSYAEPYGTRRYEVDNDFLNNIHEVEVSFSPTPLQIDGNSDRFVPRIYDNDISEGAKPTESNPRILYFDRKICNPAWTFREEVSGSNFATQIYPYAGHLDEPLAPALDLNFGIPDELYYQANGYTGTLQYTNANLYNLYHRSHVEEITNKDSKILKGEFYLTPLDIQKLDFRDQILIDNTYWRLNKVSDYNPFKDGLTKVELFKVLDLVQQENEVFSYGNSGTIGSGLDKENKPKDARKFRRFSQFNPTVGMVKGRRNTVEPNAKDYKILGDNNFIGDSSKNITILGDGNYVASNLENVTIINSDNQEVYESNTTIIDGKLTWKHVETDVDYTAKDREFVLADSSKAAPPITITLPTLAEDLWVCVKKTDSSVSNVDITPGVSGTIDGVGTYSLTTQYESVELFCDGSNWHIRANG